MKYVRVLVKQIQDFCVECFLKFGVPKEDAENVAEHLILANLRGVDSHGIMRVPYYREGIRKGLVKPGAEISIVNESTGISLLDGGNGLGIPVATKATGLAIDKAKSIGSPCVDGWSGMFLLCGAPSNALVNTSIASANPYPLYPPKGRRTPSNASLESVVGLPCLSKATPL